MATDGTVEIKLYLFLLYSFNLVKDWWIIIKLVLDIVLSMFIPLCSTYDNILLSMSVCDHIVLSLCKCNIYIFLFLKYLPVMGKLPNHESARR